MANVVFKRGYQADLPNVAEDGVFYLTQDTNRLYVGQSTSLQLLNQNVSIVPNLEALTTTSNAWDTDAKKAAHKMDFYYVTDKNILAVWTIDPENSSAYKWVQINPDTNTYLASQVFSNTASGSVASVTLTSTLSNETPITATVAVEVAGGLDIASATAQNGILITGNEYALARSVSSNVATVTLSSSNLSTTSGFALEAGSNVEITSTGTNAIVIKAADNSVASATMTLGNNGSINLTLTKNDETPITASLANIGVVLNDNTFVTLGDTSAKSAGAIYSKAEIDNLLNGLDGMTYKGTIAPAGTSATVNALPSQHVKNGDTYVVSAGGLTSANLGGTVSTGNLPSTGAIVGDMFIASGTEGNNGEITGTIQWTYIPSGNDSLAEVTYTTKTTTSTNTIKMENGNEQEVFALSLQAGDGISISSTAAGATATQMTTTITHATYTTTTSTTAASSSNSFEAITGITLNNGHVTQIESQTFTPQSYLLSAVTSSSAVVNSYVANGTRVSTATNAGLNDVSVYTSLMDGDETVINSSAIKLISSNIKLSAGSNAGEVVMNMEWGTF